MHSQIHGTWFQGVPGVKIACPSSPAEAKGLLKAAVRDDNPVIFVEHKRLYSVKGPAPEVETIPLGTSCAPAATSPSSRGARACPTRSPRRTR